MTRILKDETRDCLAPTESATAVSPAAPPGLEFSQAGLFVIEAKNHKTPNGEGNSERNGPRPSF